MPCYFEAPQSSVVVVGNSAPEPGLHLHRCVQQSYLSVSLHMPMSTVVEIFRRMGVRTALVIDDGRLVGVISKKDVIRHLELMRDRTLSYVQEKCTCLT